MRVNTTQKAETLRLFFALWPDESLRAAIALATRAAVRESGGRPVPAGNLHVTLLFVGSVAESRVPDLLEIGARVAAGPGTQRRAAMESTASPQLVFDRIEFWKKPRALVATPSAPFGAGHDAAERLARSLQREAVRAGFTPDLEGSSSVGSEVIEPLRFHVTLARKVVSAGPSDAIPAVNWNCTSFVLAESRTEPLGAIYHVVKSFPLSEADRS